MDKWLKTGSLKTGQCIPTISTFAHIANKKIKIKYCQGYLSYGFVSIRDSSAPNGQCVICFKPFNNSLLSSTKLQRKFRTNQSEYKDKPL